MIPFFWTDYTATLQGRVLKLVPCENCSVEYVYVLERVGEGVGTSFYGLYDDGAPEDAVSGAKESLQESLKNDFEPIPCPACGHYQRHMFPKLYVPAPWLELARFATLFAGCLMAVGALYCTLTTLPQPGAHALGWIATTWAAFVTLVLVHVALGAVERSRVRRFDPNTGDPTARIEDGRRQAITRAEFEAAQRDETESKNST